MLRPTYPVRTPRLNLRPFAGTDLAALHAIYNHPEVTRHLTWEPRRPLAVRDLLARKTEHTRITGPGETLSLAVVLVDTGDVIGDAVLTWVRGEHDNGELNVILHPKYQGQGYGAEICLLLLRLGFEGLELHQIFGACETADVASASLMEGLGMRRDATLRERERLEAQWSDELVYTILAVDWHRRSAKM